MLGVVLQEGKLMHKAVNKGSIGGMGLCCSNFCGRKQFLIPLVDFVNDILVSKFWNQTGHLGGSIMCGDVDLCLLKEDLCFGRCWSLVMSQH